MADLKIIDSGYVTKNEIGIKESFIANAGIAITLKGVNLTYARGAKVDNSPVVGSDENAELNPVGITNPLITISGIIDRASSDEMAQIILFDSLARTKGTKLLYYGSTDNDISDGSGGDGWNNVISKLGEQNLNGQEDEKGSIISDIHTASTSSIISGKGGELYNSGDPYPHLHILLKGLSIKQGSSSQKIRFALTCEVQ